MQVADSSLLVFTLRGQESAAVSSLREEEARAYDREALLGEMMLAERDKEDRCGDAGGVDPSRQ